MGGAVGMVGGTPGPDGGTGPAGPTGPTSATPYRLDFTGADVAGAGASQVVQWATDAVGALDRIVAVRSYAGPLQFTIASPASTIWLEVLNDNGDTVYQCAIDDAHYTPDPSTDGTGSLPLVVGPYGWQGANPYTIQVRTDAASLSLVDPASGAARFCEIEIVTMAPTVTVDPTPVFP